jgi:membrane-bound transcription factor site-1 protease
MPLIFNTTILNGMGVAGQLSYPPEWQAGENGDLLEIAFSYSDILWPWSGYLAVHIKVREEAKSFRGFAVGLVQLTIRSPPAIGERVERTTTLSLPIRVEIIPTPPRSKRVLWDQYHNLLYPTGFFPNDVLWEKTDPFDWNGDHIHTNFRSLYGLLRGLGYFVETLGDPLSCFNPDHYGTLIIADPEDEFAASEIEFLQQAVQLHGLSVLVLADWYNTKIIETVKFYDDNTDKWWTPFTG